MNKFVNFENILSVSDSFYLVALPLSYVKNAHRVVDASAGGIIMEN
jgi:hypothetical protein